MPKREICNQCLRPIKVCYCHTIHQLKTNSKILIFRHCNERSHPFNTARMAKLSLDKCQIIDSDNSESSEALAKFIDDHNPFLLFLTNNSQFLSEKSVQELPSHNFILLDGTWNKAKKLFYTHSVLSRIPVFHLNPRKMSIYKPIRSACSKKFISTIEAIYETLKIIHPNEEFKNLMAPLHFTVDKQTEIRKVSKK